MNPGRHLVRPLVLALAALGSTAGAHAAQVLVTVNVENLAPANSVTFAPLHVGFHGGTFDSFDLGEAATAGIISVAEGGSGAAWFPAFMAADPGGVLGSVAGPLFQGGARPRTRSSSTRPSIPISASHRWSCRATIFSWATTTRADIASSMRRVS